MNFLTFHLVYTLFNVFFYIVFFLFANQTFVTVSLIFNNKLLRAIFYGFDLLRIVILILYKQILERSSL